MKKYHSRRPEKMIHEQTEMLEIIREQNFFTLALCNGQEPYLVSMNYAYDDAENCFYFHCSPEGKKMDYLKVNSVVWGQILEDRGYLRGECDHSYRTLQFKGKVEFLQDLEEIRSVLMLMIDQLEENPEPIKKRFIEAKSFDHVAIGRIRVEGMSGKKAR